MNFKKQHIWLIGSTVPSYEYGLSYNNTWKKDLLTTQTIKLGPQKQTLRRSQPIFFKKLRKIKSSQLKLNKHNLAAKNIYHKFHQKHSKRIKGITRNQYIKNKCRNRISLLHKRTQFLSNPHKQDLITPRNHTITFLRRRSVMFPFKQKHKLRFRRYKNNYKMYINTLKAFRKVNIVKIIKQKPNHLINLLVKKSLFSMGYSNSQKKKKNVKPSRQLPERLNTSSTLILRLSLNKRTFRNIKNHVRVKRKPKKMYWKRYKVLTKFLNLKLNFKPNSILFAKYFLVKKAGQKVFFTPTNLGKQSQIISKKWEYSKPYQFTGNKFLKNEGKSSLRDIYLNKNLHQQTSYKKRSKRLQFYQKSKEKKKKT